MVSCKAHLCFASHFEVIESMEILYRHHDANEDEAKVLSQRRRPMTLLARLRAAYCTKRILNIYYTLAFCLNPPEMSTIVLPS